MYIIMTIYLIILKQQSGSACMYWEIVYLYLTKRGGGGGRWYELSSSCMASAVTSAGPLIKLFESRTLSVVGRDFLLR